MKKICGCQAVITAVRVTWRPGCFYVCIVQWVFVLLGLAAAFLLLEALPGDAVGMKLPLARLQALCSGVSSAGSQ